MTRQLHYSPKNPNLSLDLALFINGLPVITFELKNNLTKQTVADAVEQYRHERDPREDLFRPGRCAAHMAVDENRIRFCTELAGELFTPLNACLSAARVDQPPKNLHRHYTIAGSGCVKFALTNTLTTLTIVVINGSLGILDSLVNVLVSLPEAV